MTRWPHAVMSTGKDGLLLTITSSHVVRNVICSAIPSKSRLHARVFEFSKLVSDHLLPRTTAYHEIWLDNKMVAGEAVKDFEPLYGEFYLPRKVNCKYSFVRLMFV